MKMKKNQDEQFQDFNEALDNFCKVIIEELKIIEILDFLTKMINKIKGETK